MGYRTYKYAEFFRALDGCTTPSDVENIRAGLLVICEQYTPDAYRFLYNLTSEKRKQLLIS